MFVYLRHPGIFENPCQMNNTAKWLIFPIFKYYFNWYILLPLPVIQWVVYCNKSFQSNGYSHENWACYCNLRKWVQYIREKHDVYVRCKMKLFPETFQDATKELKKTKNMFKSKYGLFVLGSLVKSKESND